MLKGNVIARLNTISTIKPLALSYSAAVSPDPKITSIFPTIIPPQTRQIPTMIKKSSQTFHLAAQSLSHLSVLQIWNKKEYRHFPESQTQQHEIGNHRVG